MMAGRVDSWARVGTYTLQPAVCIKANREDNCTKKLNTHKEEITEQS